ncbi:MAG TPA: CoA-binding protein [Mycobacteriales bacterium]|jgi:hypothetical protein|nr:CoA-binding protein [Mycobacteriales bacterium]
MRTPQQVLSGARTIAVVGASADPDKAAHRVPAVLQRRGWRIVPVNPNRDEVLGEKSYPSLADVPEDVDVVEVFRPAAEAAEVVRQAVARGVPAVWLQAGIVSEPARAIADEAGVDYVENTCMKVVALGGDLHPPS